MDDFSQLNRPGGRLHTPTLPKGLGSTRKVTKEPLTGVQHAGTRTRYPTQKMPPCPSPHFLSPPSSFPIFFSGPQVVASTTADAEQAAATNRAHCALQSVRGVTTFFIASAPADAPTAVEALSDLFAGKAIMRGARRTRMIKRREVDVLERQEVRGQARCAS